jgi:hypothetical protein
VLREDGLGVELHALQPAEGGWGGNAANNEVRETVAMRDAYCRGAHTS